MTQAELMELLHYCPKTGKFTWVKPNPSAKRIQAGDTAGRAIQNGYVQIGINGKYFLAHRLAYLYMTGDFPEKLVDHINGNTQDNSWQNLRLASASENSRNAKRSSRNTSGFTGVAWNNVAKKWVASIRLAGKSTHLGCFDTAQAAAEARKAAEKTGGYHVNHGR